jgi:hypothetical protein
MLKAIKIILCVIAFLAVALAAVVGIACLINNIGYVDQLLILWKAIVG